MTLHRLAPLALVLAACGDDGGGGGATSDAAPPDPCAPDATFTGEIVDWDSTASAFMGVGGLTMIRQGDPNDTATTAPNGRFDFQCIPIAADRINVGGGPASDYGVANIVVDPNVLRAQVAYSYRMLPASRAADFGFSTSQSHIYVQVVGAPRTVTAAATPGTMHTFDGTTWSPGNTGNAIYLGNVPGDVNEVTNLVVSGGTVTAPTSIPLFPGGFTFVTIIAR